MNTSAKSTSKISIEDRKSYIFLFLAALSSLLLFGLESFNPKGDAIMISLSSKGVYNLILLSK